jgi:hypothetical protein
VLSAGKGAFGRKAARRMFRIGDDIGITMQRVFGDFRKAASATRRCLAP